MSSFVEEPYDTCLYVSWPLWDGQPPARREKEEEEGDLEKEEGYLEEKWESFLLD